MVKHTQTIRREQATNCLSVFDHFVGVAVKGLSNRYETSYYFLKSDVVKMVTRLRIFSDISKVFKKTLFGVKVLRDNYVNITENVFSKLLV